MSRHSIRVSVLPAISALAVMLVAATVDPSGNWARLHALPLEARQRLVENLQKFDLRYSPDQQRGLRDLDRRINELDSTQKAQYLATAHRYHNWLDSLPEKKQDDLKEKPPAERMELIKKLVKDFPVRQASTARFLQFVDVGDFSPFELAAIYQVWQTLPAADRQQVERMQPGPRRKRFFTKEGMKKMAAEFDRQGFDEAKWVRDLEAFAENQKIAFFLLELKAGEDGRPHEVLRRQAINFHYLLENYRPKPVDPDDLDEFLTSFPPWLRSRFDHHSPDEARRRLTVVYRLVFPPGREIKQASRPASPPAGARTSPAPAPRHAEPWRQGSVRGGQLSLLTTATRRVGRIFVEAEDVRWMRQALLEAARGLGSVEPNPMVGAVVVRDHQLVGTGHHERFGGPHAEVNALGDAGERARGATLYVTLEPCCHFGKTPPCTDAILSAGIARVVVAMGDPFPRVDGRGLSMLEAKGLHVVTGCEAGAARVLNEPYLKRTITGRPFVIAKWAMTLDGKTAAASGDSRWISSEQSRALVHELRGRMDAIVVGIGTVESDDPLLTARPPGPRVPARLVFDSAGRLPLSSRLAQTAREVPVVVATTEQASHVRGDQLSRLGCDVIRFPGSGRVPIEPLLDELGRRGMTNVLVEGGGRVLGSFFDDGQVDAVDVYIAPILEGGDHARTGVRGRGVNLMRDASRLRHIELSQIGGDFRVCGRLPQTWRTRAGLIDDE